MTNPLLQQSTLPPFAKIKPEHIVPAVETAIANCKKVIESALEKPNYTWDNFIQQIDEADDAFSRLWSPVSHLNSVKNSNELREAYEACLPILTNYSTWVSQHKGLYHAYKKLHQSDEFKTLNIAQQKSITNAIRDFELSGIGLDDEKQKKYGEIVMKLTELSSSFSNNVLDATMAFTKLITNEADIKGLPQSAIDSAKALAESKNQQGWLFTLDMPSYLPIMTYCDNRELRFEMYQAFVTRASDQGPNAGQFDNTQNIVQMLTLRSELASLLNFESYAHKSLATKMAKDPHAVIDFLTDLAAKAKKQAQKELDDLTQFAAKHYGVTELQPWDIGYYSEKQKQYLYAIDNELLRAYFPEPVVVAGLFEVVRRLFGISIKKRDGVEVWDESVSFYDVYDQKGDYKASFYLDLYAREHKRGGAWMDHCVSQMKLKDGSIQKPVAYLTCNFNRTTGDKPALFTMEEVTTLFHEFGHGLHHMLTTVDVSAVSGINGVAWDAVELPSQFLENWCYEPQALAFISAHYETGEPLPAEMLDKMLAAKNYQTGLFILRQVEFAMFDMKLHLQTNANNADSFLKVLDEVKKQVAVIKTAPFARSPHSFSHIFAGGYAAGYYSYLWADVLSSDAYSRFKNEGIFNPKTGQAFLDCILSQGGTREPMELFKDFMGRAPDNSALLRQYGII